MPFSSTFEHNTRSILSGACSVFDKSEIIGDRPSPARSMIRALNNTVIKDRDEKREITSQGDEEQIKKDLRSKRMEIITSTQLTFD